MVTVELSLRECYQAMILEAISKDGWLILMLTVITTFQWVNSLTTRKQTTKFSSANFQKILSPRYIILRIQILEGKQCISR